MITDTFFTVDEWAWLMSLFIWKPFNTLDCKTLFSIIYKQKREFMQTLRQLFSKNVCNAFSHIS